MRLEDNPVLNSAHNSILKLTDGVIRLGMVYELGCLIGFSMSLTAVALGFLPPEFYSKWFRLVGFLGFVGTLILLLLGLCKRLFFTHWPAVGK